MRLQKLFNVLVIGGAILGGGCATTGAVGSPADGAPGGGTAATPDGGSPGLGAATPALEPAPEPAGRGARFW
jgi:hypothetical protein